MSDDRRPMSKAQRAAEVKYPDDPATSHDTRGLNAAARTGFGAGVAWALPEEPDESVIEAMANVLMMWARGDSPVFDYREDADYAAHNLYAALRGVVL